MNPQAVWCPNLACPARGKVGQGNVGVLSQRERRYCCHVCGKTFAQGAPARTGTIFHRRRTAEATITQVLTLVSWGCPVVAIEHAFGLHPQTIRAWLEAAGQHAEAVHHAQVVQPRDLGQVQADEVRVKTQCGIVWMAMAMMVSTRLWLGGVISTNRDHALITRLVQLTPPAPWSRRCCWWSTGSPATWMHFGAPFARVNISADGARRAKCRGGT